MKSETYQKFIAIALVLILAGCAAPTGQVTAKQTRIGVLLPLSGDLSVTGEKLERGVRLASDDLPQGMQLIYEDSGSTTVSAVSAAKKLIEVDHVDVIIGAYSPDQALAVAPIAKEAGIIVFSPSFCSDSFKEHDNLFCGYPGATDQLATVDDLFKSKKITRVALVDQNSDFGQSSRAAMQAKAQTLGYDVVLDELTQGGEKDFRTIVAKVMDADVDAVFSATDGPGDALQLMKQLSESGYDGTRITFIDPDNKYLALYGERVNATYAPGIAPSSFSAEFTSRYLAKYDTQPDYAGALGYDILHVVSAVSDEPFTVSDVTAYAYANPAIGGFHYLPDRTVSYRLELWQAVNGEYRSAQ